MSLHFSDKYSLSDNNHRITRAFHSKDYSLVLNYLYPLYSYFYHEKRKIYRALPSKKASTRKEEYYQWKNLYHQHSFQYNYSKMLKTIIRYSEENKVQFQNIEGGDILKRTFAMKQYCDMFYKIK